MFLSNNLTKKVEIIGINHLNLIKVTNNKRRSIQTINQHFRINFRRIKLRTTYIIISLDTIDNNSHLRTTLMVGHPGETEDDFEELKEFVRKIRFDRMGAFTYSEEEGTYAAKHYEDSVSPGCPTIKVVRR